VDTNKLLAATLKVEKTRRLLMLAPVDFFTLSYAIDEIKEYQDEICRRVGLDQEIFNYILF